MSVARLVVAAVRFEGRSKAEVAREYRVSRPWVHELIKRFDAEGEAGLEPRSRRPHRSPAQTPADLEEEIVELRKALSDQGLDAGAHTIAYHLAHSHGRAPAVATIWRILSRRGFVTPQPQKRPKSSFVRFEADQPNERWQADITHWIRAGGDPVDILNVLDASMLTDNGAVFTGISRGGGRCAIEVELDALGVLYRHSSPYHPQTCGKVERFHQTLKRWLAKQPAAHTAQDLQAQLDWFRAYYNNVRPHRAVGRRTPMVVFEARPKAAPSRRGLLTPAHCRIRKDRIDSSGVITLRYNSRLHHVGLGRRHAGLRVVVLVADLDVRILTEDGDCSASSPWTHPRLPASGDRQNV